MLQQVGHVLGIHRTALWSHPGREVCVTKDDNSVVRHNALILLGHRTITTTHRPGQPRPEMINCEDFSGLLIRETP